MNLHIALAGLLSMVLSTFTACGQMPKPSTLVPAEAELVVPLWPGGVPQGLAGTVVERDTP